MQRQLGGEPANIQSFNDLEGRILKLLHQESGAGYGSCQRSQQRCRFGGSGEGCEEPQGCHSQCSEGGQECSYHTPALSGHTHGSVEEVL